ncbi:MAG: hypothetical protein VX256_10840 [Pseudomonadota bacterium]|jgi:hypothetical protein|uniref:hypothetical protein n=1 Tax=Alcanivorax sp. DSM 26293 TaxID=1798238 RepID=UPI000CDF2BB1|nr:hypothetical protein [Alcanivorax sp. DSM 26293]MEE3388639.1 hypothetical protein [Pseudomonadota bacterium]
MTTGATMITDEQRLQQQGLETLSKKAKAFCERQYRRHGPIAGCDSCPLAKPCRTNPAPDDKAEHQRRILSINATAAWLPWEAT